jgi:cyclic beta-1,2-glucan synthetase
MKDLGRESYVGTGRLAASGEAAAALTNIDGSGSGALAAGKIRASLRQLERARSGFGGDKPGAAGEWLLDNWYLARREGISAAAAMGSAGSLRLSGKEPYILILCKTLAGCGQGEVTAERCAKFLEGVQRTTTLTQKELALFPDALRGALILSLAEEYGGTPDEKAAAALFTSLRLVSALDFTPLLDSVNRVEQTLRRDPAGVYPLMDDESRRDYRDTVTKLARARGVQEYQLAEKILELAESARGGERHVGYWLYVRPAGDAPKRRSGAWYISANLLLTLFFALLPGFALKSPAASLLLLLPVSELVKSLLDFIIMRFLKPRRIPRLSLEEGVPDEGRTICVVSALLSSPDSGKKLAEKLERFRLLNREGGRNLTFGILADLREGKSEELPEDGDVLSAARESIEALNKKYGGGFYLFGRRRVLCKPDGVYRGYERKRGAVLALAQYILGRGGSLQVLAGDPQALDGTRYILTLDSDTELLPGAAGELIGAMLHPLNRPVTDGERGVVISGHGVIHPRVSTELESAARTDFSRVFAGQGGTDPYGSLCGELYMDLFGRGGFAGKGIIDADALLKCCGDLPDNTVLSHDALEGAFLRGGYMGDCELTDGFPSRPLAYFRRMHRWTRGDWQNLPWIFARGRALSDIDRWKLFDSLRRSLVAPLTFAAIFAGFFIKTGGLATAAAAALLALASRLFVSLAELSAQKARDARRRYHSAVVYGLGGAIMQTFLRLWLLPFEAWTCISAICASLWRMAVSGKNLLQWETAAQTETNHSSLKAHILGMWSAVLPGILCALLARSIIGRAAGLIWLTAPAAAWALSLPAKNKAGPGETSRRYLTEKAREIWLYFDRFCAPEDNYLPPDNFQMQPPVGLAHRTSPTNIGLALVSCLAAMDVGVDSGGAMEHIENMLASVMRLPKWHGHLYNWYDTRSLRPLQPQYVSTVDSGNLFACLTALKAGLSQYGRDDLASQAASLCADMDFAPLYDASRRLFYIGLDARSDKPSGGWYDLMASEARLTSYIAVARGDVSRRHWARLSRAQLQKDGFHGLASWSGTMFEYLMPELFLPLCPDSMLYESARFCMYVQRRRVRPGEPWGVSESAFFALDPALNYRYKASGCGALALKRGQDRELVISPYSSFLALAVEPGAALRNLRRLEKRGAGCAFGFYEALDFTPTRCRGREGELVKCVMCHHLGMSMVSAANFLCGGIMQRRFMSDPAMGAYRCLLEERVPTGGGTVQRDGEPPREKPKRDSGELWSRRGQGADFENPECCLLSNGVYNIMSTEFGMTAAVCRDTAVYLAPESPVSRSHGVDFYLRAGGNDIPLLPVPGDGRDILWELGENSAGVTVCWDAVSARCSLAAASGFSGEMRFVELNAINDIEGSLELSFVPVLAKFDDYVNHPAFWRLGISAVDHKGCLMLRRLARGGQPEMWLCLACSAPMTFSAGRDGGMGALSWPLVRAHVNVHLSSGEKLSLRFSLCLGGSRAEAYNGAQRLLALGPADYGDMPGACAALTGMSAREIGEAMNAAGRVWFPRTGGMCSREMLWRWSVSGDLPIILCRAFSADDVAAPLRQFFLIRSCGVLCDLVFVTDDGGEYSRPVSRAVEDGLERCGLEPLLGVYGGVHVLSPAALEAVRSCAAVVIGPDSPPQPLRRTGVKYMLPSDGGRGGVPPHEWSGEGFEFYVNQFLPSRCWSDILTNGQFGYIAADCGTGHMWYRNAREMPVNRWLNDPYAVVGGETLEIECGGERRSLFAAPDGVPCRVFFGFGAARWRREFPGFDVTVTAFVPRACDARVFIIETAGAAEGSVLWKTDLALSGDPESAKAVSIDYVNYIFSVRSTRSYIDDAHFLAAASEAPEAYVCDGAKWLRGELDNSTVYASQPVIGARYPLTRCLILSCGCCGEDELSALCQLEAVRSALDDTAGWWRALLGKFKMDGGGALEHMMNGWCQYQALACRIMGRTSVYQSGGAFGFRDQLQDAVNLILISPAYARAQICAACRHQYVEGDVMHWWHAHPAGDRGVRTRCSDDMLWLVWALCEYTEKTGDLSICADEYDYVNSVPLPDQERDRYETPAPAQNPEGVIIHALKALECCAGRGVGPHGLYLFGSGDWSDGMDRVGGESVWLTWFFAHCAERLSKLLSKLCKPEWKKWAKHAEDAGRAADSAWDGSWYLRGYWPDGVPIGGHASVCCRIDSISQSWAAFCPQASPDRVDSALKSAAEQLFDREHKLIKLFTPPFENCSRSPGYIESYGPGFRENGGQYTHGAVWLAIACLRRGMTETGREILEALLPENHDLSRYMAEPFVLPADVYSAAGHEGEAGWTWYTGSAGWYFRAVSEELLGLKLKNGRLSVEPVLKDYTAYWTDPSGVTHTITVRDGQASVS